MARSPSNVSDPGTPSPKRVGSLSREAMAGAETEKAAALLIDMLKAKK